MPEAQYSVPDFGSIVLDLPDLPSLVSLQSYVPGLQAKAAASCDLELRYDCRLVGSLHQDAGLLTLGGLWSPHRAHDIPHLLYAIVRKSWISRGLYPAHAAAVQKLSGEAVLLAGPSGVGKTTISDALVERTGWGFISGNKTLVSADGRKMDIHAATLTRSILQPDGSRQQLQVECAGVYPIKIAAIILPYLNDGRQDWYQLSQLSALHTLFPLFLDAMNADVLIDSAAALYDGAVSAAAKRGLATALEKVLGAIPVYRGVGSLDFLCSKIEVTA